MRSSRLGGGYKRQTAKGIIDLTPDIRTSTFSSYGLPRLSVIFYLPPCLCVSLNICMSECAAVHASVQWPYIKKGFRLVVLSWHSNSPAQPRKWTSSELFQRGLVFVVPRSKTTQPYVTAQLPCREPPLLHLTTTPPAC